MPAVRELKGNHLRSERHPSHREEFLIVQQIGTRRRDTIPRRTRTIVKVARLKRHTARQPASVRRAHPLWE
jgi:hypothetical protein